MTSTPTTTGYAAVNGLEMYYEIQGDAVGDSRPLVLLHGAFSAIDSSFGQLIPGLAEGRQVVAFELQAHGRTADIDRPLAYEALADDVAAAVGKLGLGPVDLFGYSMGAFVALQVALRHPELVRKLVFMSATYALSGVHPGLMDGLGEMSPEMMHGSVWHEEYLRIAPRPQDFNTLFAKKTELDRGITDVPDEAIQALAAPTLIVIGDSDLVRPEHAVEMFRLLGGGVFGDMPPGMPDSQLAVVPGASHVTIRERAELLVPMIVPFLDDPAPPEE